MWDDVHIAHIIVAYTPHTPTRTDDKINEHTALNTINNSNEIFTADNVYNNEHTALNDSDNNNKIVTTNNTSNNSVESAANNSSGETLDPIDEYIDDDTYDANINNNINAIVADTNDTDDYATIIGDITNTDLYIDLFDTLHTTLYQVGYHLSSTV